MKNIEQTLIVALGDRSYPIMIGAELLASIGQHLADLSSIRTIALVTNETVAALYLQPVVNSLVAAGYAVHPVLIPDGEEFKSAETLALIYDAAFVAGLDRGGMFLALGGGVVGDLTGFAAATFLRGVPFVQVPTTVLAQVDSSVGGKTGINHPRGKNLIGAFHQPLAVVADVATLLTLSERDYCSGLAEVVKYGMVLDEGFFTYLESNAQLIRQRNLDCLQHMVLECCRLKAQVVEQDEREGGLRAVLNYGHTFGHAVETLTKYQQFTHGEAVSIGMVQAARLALQQGFGEHSVLQRLTRLLQIFNLPLVLPEFSTKDYDNALRSDKKVREGALTFVLNKAIGAFCFVKIDNVQAMVQQLVKNHEIV
jgi:3-dehydroquinate synthase